MAKSNTIDEVLDEKGFTPEEKKVFHEMIGYAKICQKGMEENLKSLIDEKIKGIIGK